MRYLIVQDWKNTSNNHAGMKYLALQLHKLYPDTIAVYIVPDYDGSIGLKRNIWGNFVYKLQNRVNSFFVKIGLTESRTEKRLQNIKKELTIVFYSCRIQLTSTDVENKILGESTMKTKFMTLMTVATLGIFSAATVMAAGNNDFYTQPPAGSEWEKADTEGTYASYTNGNDYVNIYKYSLEDVKTGIAKCNDTYDACYQTIYSEGNSLYMAVGYAKDADDISDVRKFVEYISYPGNPSLTRQENENQTDDSSDDSDKATTDTASQKSGGDSDILTTSPMTLVDSDGNTIEINYILHKDYSCEYRGDDGMNYTDNGDETYTDENGNTYSALNDDTHHLGHTLEQHDLQDANGNTVTVTETTNGDYYFQDENGTGFTDNGDGTWSDENGNSYTEID